MSDSDRLLAAGQAWQDARTYLAEVQEAADAYPHEERTPTGTSGRLGFLQLVARVQSSTSQHLSG